MGVIDLNARVTALEKNSGNSQEIDQIEADLTALEETVGGLVTDVSNKITLKSPLTGTLNCSATKIGNMVFATITADLDDDQVTYGTAYDLCTIDSSIAPAETSAGCCFDIEGKLSVVQISTARNAIVTKGGKWVSFYIFWKIATS